MQLAVTDSKTAPVQLLAVPLSPSLHPTPPLHCNRHNSLNPDAMSLIPAPSSAAHHAAWDDADVIALANGFLLITQSLAAAMVAMHHTGLLRSPLLPHYTRRLVMEKLNLLRLPHIPTSDSLTEYEDYLTHLATHQPPPNILLRLVQQPARFERTTRLSVAEFVILYKELKPFILRPLQGKRKRGDRTRTRSLHPADQFLLWVWHSDGGDADVLGFLFNGISRWTATRIADHVTTAVLDAWVDEVSWPDAEERRLLYVTGACGGCQYVRTTSIKTREVNNRERTKHTKERAREIAELNEMESLVQLIEYNKPTIRRPGKSNARTQQRTLSKTNQY